MSPLGDFTKRAAAPACVTSRNWHARKLAASTVSVDAPGPRLARLNELSTTPSSTDGEYSFTITHPFHPLCGQSFPLLSQSRAWGEERVFFADPQSHQIRSQPLAWTNLALPDPFLVVADGKTLLRFEDIQHLNQMLKTLPTHQKEDR